MERSKTKRKINFIMTTLVLYGWLVIHNAYYSNMCWTSYHNKYLCFVSLIFMTINSQHRAAELREFLFVLSSSLTTNVIKTQELICASTCMYMYNLI